MTLWQRWVAQPQSVWLRRALFQVHLWVGLSLGLYVVVISLTGSVLVYRNEIYRAFSPQPVVVAGSGEPMSIEDLKDVARRLYPGFEVTEAREGKTSNHAVEVAVQRGDDVRRRLLHPFTGEDLGNPLPVGFRVAVWLLDLHDNLLSGPTGRAVNGVGALLLIALCLTGAVVWWPGIRSCRRSLTLDLAASSKRLIWSLHSALGFWFFAFILMWGVTGAYLSLPQAFAAVFDAIQPLDESSLEERTVDRIQYWLAYLHFGRLGGRGIPGCGRLCNSTTKIMWAAFGFVPVAMFVTGTLMWWSRVIRPAARQQQG